jgi:hypothetical protein
MGEDIRKLDGDPLALGLRRPFGGERTVDPRSLCLRRGPAVLIKCLSQAKAERPRADADDQTEQHAGLEVGEPAQAGECDQQRDQDGGKPGEPS